MPEKVKSIFIKTIVSIVSSIIVYLLINLTVSMNQIKEMQYRTAEARYCEQKATSDWLQNQYDGEYTSFITERAKTYRDEIDFKKKTNDAR